MQDACSRDTPLRLGTPTSRNDPIWRACVALDHGGAALGVLHEVLYALRDGSHLCLAADHLGLQEGRHVQAHAPAAPAAIGAGGRRLF
jgi:hypothetical protein